MNFLSDLEKQSQLFLILGGFVLIGVICTLDFLTGYELAFSLFYVLPISMITWFTNRRLGVAASVASALAWLFADVSTGHPYSSALIPTWNTLIRLSFFIIITWLLSALRIALKTERDTARLDYLTGAINSRQFFELARFEIDRFQRYRHPFTVAYFDMDNFKTVNDQFGHATGDKVLRAVVNCAKKLIRRTDVIGRMGGDEFILLLPETDQTSAREALTKIQDGLLKEMQQCAWPITFSIGALTCQQAAPATPDELVRRVDELMYQVKNTGKNAIRYATYSGGQDLPVNE